jgi:hypothetical protein
LFVAFAGHRDCDGGLRQFLTWPSHRLHPLPAGLTDDDGAMDGDRTTFSAALARRKGLTLVLARRMGEVYPRAIDLAARGLVDLATVVSTAFPLAEVDAAFAAAAARTGLKVVVRPQS